MKKPSFANALKASTAAIQAVLGRTIRIEVGCDALEAAVAYLARKQGADLQKILHAIDQIEKAALQNRLEQVERLDPSAAAELDQRPERLEIDEFLS